MAILVNWFAQPVASQPPRLLMHPAVIEQIERMPWLASGKPDRRGLPEIRRARRSIEGHVPPRSPAEQRLAAIWEELLDAAPAGIRDNFFGLGGNSLLAAQLAGRIGQAYGTRLQLAALLDSLPPPWLPAAAPGAGSGQAARSVAGAFLRGGGRGSVAGAFLRGGGRGSVAGLYLRLRRAQRHIYRRLLPRGSRVQDFGKPLAIEPRLAAMFPPRDALYADYVGVFNWAATGYRAGIYGGKITFFWPRDVAGGARSWQPVTPVTGRKERSDVAEHLVDGGR